MIAYVLGQDRLVVIFDKEPEDVSKALLELGYDQDDIDLMDIYESREFGDGRVLEMEIMRPSIHIS